jgi:hypothetical protein
LIQVDILGEIDDFNENGSSKFACASGCHIVWIARNPKFFHAMKPGERKE